MFLQTSVVAVRHSPATAAKRGRSTTSVTMLWSKLLESGSLISMNLGVRGLYVTSKETENIHMLSVYCINLRGAVLFTRIKAT